MGTKGEDLLWTMLWACDMFSRPTFRNLTDSFESWAYRSGYLRQLQRLERRQLIESLTDSSGDRLHRLTEAGCLLALGGRDPERLWGRRWDGRWRMAIFDVAEAQASTRDKLRRYLRSRSFGYLQHSVWITPDPLDEERALLSDGPVNVESLILLEARPCAGETNAEIVAGAWDFSKINQRYAAHEQVLTQRPRAQLPAKTEATVLYRWLCEERESWNAAMALDPLLPRCLLPSPYAGISAWRHRMGIMAEVGEWMRRFRLD